MAPDRPASRIFAVDTRFQTMARREGGVSREQALRRAEARIEKIRPELAGVIEREIEFLCESLRHAQPGCGHPSLTQRIYEGCCSLRDIGTTIGFPLVSFVARNLCQILDTHGTFANTERVIACHIEALSLARTPQYRNKKPEQLPTMAGGLSRILVLATANQTGSGARARKAG